MNVKTKNTIPADQYLKDMYMMAVPREATRLMTIPQYINCFGKIRQSVRPKTENTRAIMHTKTSRMAALVFSVPVFTPSYIPEPVLL
ncbi:hypothetical protein WN66_05996 [Saccharomyces cerevisiae]|jgi:hypothetical protein|uniref:Putative uncharacterized protein YOR161W-B n=1 Tax=Saccharomyces cerevisiae (strain ATCC 204508 / S288c) TaxID=559292 RepID=YO61B_YEAST|nr:RecName: Full=Putative uncharacterized protein YOR161W-B [Saccharomyces cerevisiae S288C]AAL79291.1 unknown [Saccharomyces cerevisiae]KZV08050.1 hypothetical protein WN66_05996 [Saccharomyces cerevisiae]